MPNTHSLISSVTVGSGGAATIGFSSIPAIYTDLLVKLSTRNADAGWTTTSLKINFNGVTGTAYSRRSIYNTSAGSAGSNSNTGQSSLTGGMNGQGSSSTSNTFDNSEIYIPNYSSSNTKPFVIQSISENNGTDTAQQITAALFSDTSAISSISIASVNGGNFVQYSTATLYGIVKS